jgi:hypothetical protein
MRNGGVQSIGCCRMTMRYQTTRLDDAGLRQRMRAIAQERRRSASPQASWPAAVPPNHLDPVRPIRTEHVKRSAERVGSTVSHQRQNSRDKSPGDTDNAIPSATWGRLHASLHCYTRQDVRTYVFRGKSGKLIKILWHDGLGMSLYA